MRELQDVRMQLQLITLEKENLTQDLKHVGQQRDELIGEHSEELQQSANAMEQLQKQLNDAIEQKSALSDKVDALQDTLNAAKEHLSSMVDLQRQQKEASEAKSKLLPDLADKNELALVHEIVGLRERLDQLMQSNAQLQEQIAQSTMDSMKAMAASKTSALRETTQDAATTDTAEVVRLRDENAALKLKLSQALDKTLEADQLEKRLHEYAMELNRQKKLNWDLEERVKTKPAKPVQAIPTQEDEEHGSNELLKMILQLTATNKQLNNRLQALRGEVSGLTRSIASTGTK